MKILDLFKEKYFHAIAKKRTKTVKRKQFNMVVSQDIILTVKYLAIILHVPYYVLTEYLLQVGINHIANDIDDVEKIKILKEHLVKAHLRGNM